MFEINEEIAGIEEAFNVAGSIPIVAMFSSAVRFIAAKIQVLVGLVIGLLGLVRFGWENKETPLAQFGFHHVKHGLWNALRSLIEELLSLTIIGPLFLGISQAAKEDGFKPRIAYRTVDVIPSGALRAS